MSALPPKADIGWHQTNVRFVPIADISQASLLGFERKQKDRLAAVCYLVTFMLRRMSPLLALSGHPRVANQCLLSG